MWTVDITIRDPSIHTCFHATTHRISCVEVQFALFWSSALVWVTKQGSSFVCLLDISWVCHKRCHTQYCIKAIIVWECIDWKEKSMKRSLTTRRTLLKEWTMWLSFGVVVTQQEHLKSILDPEFETGSCIASFQGSRRKHQMTFDSRRSFVHSEIKSSDGCDEWGACTLSMAISFSCWKLRMILWRWWTLPRNLSMI